MKPDSNITPLRMEQPTEVNPTVPASVERTDLDAVAELAAPEDAGRGAASDAGVSRRGGRHHARATAAVPRVRDAESDRARGHVPAARSAARSLHVPGGRRLSERARSGRDRAPADQRSPP